MLQALLGLHAELADEASRIAVGELLRVQARMPPEAPVVTDRTVNPMHAESGPRTRWANLDCGDEHPTMKHRFLGVLKSLNSGISR
jgi:hypothetical protein